MQEWLGSEFAAVKCRSVAGPKAHNIPHRLVDARTSGNIGFAAVKCQSVAGPKARNIPHRAYMCTDKRKHYICSSHVLERT
jgi:hypothetical protein